MTRLVLPDASQPIRLDASDVDRLVVDALDASGLSRCPVARIGDLIEEQIAAYLAELTLRRVAAMAQSTGRRFRSVPPGFYLDAQVYEIRITKHALDFATIQLAIVKAGTSLEASSPLTPVKLLLDGTGPHSTAMLYVSEELKSIEELVATDVQATFTAGYRWLEAQVMGRVTPTLPGIADDLYTKLRSVLHPELADRVGLYGVCKQDAFYLLDRRMALTALARAAKQRGSAAVSPIEGTTLLVTQLLDPRETMSRISLAEGRRRLLELEKSPYALTRLNLAERVFYRTNNLMHYPLVRDGKLQLTAAYPAHMNEYIAPALDRISDGCTDIARKHAKSALKRVYRQRREQYAPRQAEDVVRLAGIFTGAAARSFAEEL
jgi:hypothetical protein